MTYSPGIPASFGMAGKTVVVTGGATGIGAKYASAFAAAGVNVVIVDLPSAAAAGQAVAAEIGQSTGAEAVFAEADVTSDRDLARLVEKTQNAFGSLDMLVNNAAIYGGLGAKRGLEALSVEEWDTVLRVNARGTWQAIKAASSVMKAQGSGRIVNISSVVARTGVPGFVHYVAAKAAVEGLTRAAARELGRYGITVNAVAPGLVDGEASRELNPDTYFDAVARSRALVSPLYADDLVGTILWLCSSAGGRVTGQTIVVDGGGLFV
ncbi:SDR family NAD(P)-dependent oxidoreductase [Amycolatopsis keratiniphila]|uniref:Ketoreductase domain-containing protein n=1 Tax=Amycolatopsis keratiniphila subsp. keratiniphila TaxID=227715 RepID=A0A1W2M2W2_9PSEU|nr:SDR family NAD(P)-dependent oxidoreductase [Amycolatopsis keratiniphila]ONF74387.1 hypothetical protein AVR91_0203620 [Amycolatopsis keratiniphila subsp. keratiniphila]